MKHEEESTGPGGAIRDYRAFMLPLLRFFSDGSEHRTIEVYEPLTGHGMTLRGRGRGWSFLAATGARQARRTQRRGEAHGERGLLRLHRVAHPGTIAG